ncbi:acyl-CoA dehydrogenase family protein [Sandaracinus amylolyticus]|uniref:acyl-CoA dehydrogenase family protein n=1 Tax=Sandaracinus amylolyticus TaxID=927083 RepID=UPI001F339D50|nr:acyl-CoA dehydrogenase family protein [Sandaracinus amylolyticus]UJR80084.1 Short-chain specific acyl-CoA dehydrogenase [Sandaracinus amylolyticus]
MVRVPICSDEVLERAFVDADVIAQAWSSAGSLVDDAVATELRAKDASAALVAVVRLLGARGLLGLTVPAEFGGTYERVRSDALCLARERLGHASPLVELAFAMQGLGGYPIVARGSDALRGAWLPKVAAGEAIAAFALTEEDAGSDLGGITTTARLDGDAYVLEGTKVFISNAGIADFYTLFAATAPPGAKRRLSAFVVPAATPGVQTRPMHVLGGHPIGALELRGVRIPIANRIGEEGDGLAVALETLHKFRPTVAAAALGFAQRALDETVAHVKARRQFGAPLADLQAVQLQIADMACDLEPARLLVYRAAAQADFAAQLEPGDAEQRSRVARTGSMAKLIATEAAFRVIDRAVQLHGGRGVLHGSIVTRLYEDVRALRIYEGASDVQRLLVAREVLR